jgi:hypothetical protein
VSRTNRRIGVRRDVQDRRFRRQRLGPDGPPHDPDQVDDRQLQDEHQEDDLDQRLAILGVISAKSRRPGL